MRSAVVFGGPSPEHDVSVLTGLHAARVLAEGGETPYALYWSKTGDWYIVDAKGEARDFLEGPPRKARPLTFTVARNGGFHERRRALDVSAVVNCCHGGPGEDGTLQAAFDLAGMPSTGLPVGAAALCMDKLAFGAAISYAGLPMLPRQAIDASTVVTPTFDPPYILKPRYGGSSLGIEVVDSMETALALCETSPHLRRGGVIEPYVADSRDLNIAVRSYPTVQLSAIEAPVRRDASASTYGYHDKYLRSGGLTAAPRELPAVLPVAVEERIASLAHRVAEIIGVRSVVRIDFLVKGETVYVNELNSIPGSLASYLWVSPRVGYLDLLRQLIAEAREAPTGQFSSTGADGAVLRAALGMAAKLG